MTASSQLARRVRRRRCSPHTLPSRQFSAPPHAGPRREEERRSRALHVGPPVWVDDETDKAEQRRQDGGQPRGAQFFFELRGESCPGTSWPRRCCVPLAHGVPRAHGTEVAHADLSCCAKTAPASPAAKANATKSCDFTAKAPSPARARRRRCGRPRGPLQHLRERVQRTLTQKVPYERSSRSAAPTRASQIHPAAPLDDRRRARCRATRTRSSSGRCRRPTRSTTQRGRGYFSRRTSSP